MLSPFRHAAVALAAVLASLPAAAQQSVIAAADLAERQAFEQALQVGDFSVQRLELVEQSPRHFETTVSLDGQELTLSLYPWSVRSPEHFQVLAQIEDGSYVEVDPGESPVWRGHLLEVPGSRVSATFIDGSLDALIRVGDDQPLWAIQPARQVSANYTADDHVIYTSADNLQTDARCGGALIDPRADAAPQVPDAPVGFQGLADDEICEIACDADVEFYNKNGSSVANTEADIENIIDRVTTIYEADVSILYEITTIIVRTSEPDPYSSSNASTLLNQFQGHWNSSQGAIQRDVAHLFTGKNINGGTIGVAYLNTICNKSSAYGLSESRFTNNITSRTALTAHELGHNWSSNHCNGTSQCKIMCASLGGCGSITSFGPFATNAITNKKNSVNCLDDAVPPPPPVISSLTPDVSNPLGQQISIFGTNMLKVTSATVGGQVLTGSAVIPLNDGQVNVFLPPASVLGPVDVFLTNPGGTSTPAQVTYVAADPPVLVQPTLINTFADTQAVWTFATTPGDLCYFLIDLDNGTFPYQGFNLLDTLIPIVAVPSNAAGVGTVTIPIDPSMGGVGLYLVYSQMAFVGPPLNFITSVKSTSVF